MVKVVAINNWEELQALIPQFISWGFRGQSDASWSLTTTFERKAKQCAVFASLMFLFNLALVIQE